MKFIIFFLLLVAFAASSLAIKNEKCGLPHSADGNGLIKCAAYMPKWTYDSANNKCIEFIFGGCGGNENRFDSQEECEKVCLE